MHASNFRPVKRVVDVIRVFERIRRRLPARLLMLGDGPDRPLAEELVAELSLQDDVEFRDPQTDIATAYRRSHLFLLLSDYESFGLSALEAMACGTPVVVSRAGGLVEVVDEGQTGHLCPVGDIEAIADAACSILDDRTTWQYMSEAASRHARAQFCRDKVIPRYEQLYEQVLRKDSPLTTCPPRE
jgi:N-acetyl-alpha-D-glucosaminyl L-malate synthase BshA